MKKFLVKLMGWQNQRENTPERIHLSEQKDRAKEEASLAKERHDEIMRNRDRQYVSETTIPEGEVRRPDDSASEKAGE